ncbi:hypothetical protein MHYP_G00103640 [Metynnis hypsauchen]
MDEAGMTEKILLIFILFLISGGGKSERVTGYSGGGVLIKCRYERQYTTNQKYFCKGSVSNCADQIKNESRNAGRSSLFKTGVKNEWINRGRFSLLDNTTATEFWVVIMELTLEDSGTYQCGVHIDYINEIYTAVDLNIKEDQDYKKNISVTGPVGGGVNISCKYPETHRSDPKFLCRMMDTGGCNYKSSVKESRTQINEGKLHLHNDRAKQIFTVSFNSLTEGDSGEYWCGAESDRTSDHGYRVYTTQINLRVPGPDVLPQSSTHISSLTTKPASSSTSKLSSSPLSATDSPPPAFPVSSVVAGVSVVVLLLLIGLLFFILTLRKRNKTQGPASTQSQSHRGSSDKHTDSRDVCVYEEVKDISPSDAGASTVYSTAELLTNPSEPSQTVPTYATVHFSKNADSSTDAVTMATINKETNSCDYATVKY